MQAVLAKQQQTTIASNEQHQFTVMFIHSTTHNCSLSHNQSTVHTKQSIQKHNFRNTVSHNNWRNNYTNSAKDPQNNIIFFAFLSRIAAGSDAN